MKERIVQLLDLEQLTPSKFADIIGVQRSSVSHVISGRNKPSFDFLEKTLKAFPGLNADWLILGKGTMYEKMGRNATGSLFDIPVNQQNDNSFEERSTTPVQESSNAYENFDEAEEAKGDESVNQVVKETVKQAFKEGSSGKIVQILVIYDDDTFRAYGPSL